MAFGLFHLGVAGAAWRRPRQVRAAEAAAARDGVEVRFEVFPPTTPAAVYYSRLRYSSPMRERIGDAGWATGKVARTLTLGAGLPDADARAALAEAADWPGLTALEARGPLSAEALAAVEAPPDLRRWGVSGTATLAPVLAAAGRLPGLRVLVPYPFPTRLSAAEVAAFGGLSHLTTVVLIGVAVEPDGDAVDRIRAALPRAAVVSAP